MDYTGLAAINTQTTINSSRQPTNDRDGKALLEELVPILWILDELGVDWQRQDPSFPRNSLTGHCVVTHRFDMFRE